MAGTSSSGRASINATLARRRTEPVPQQDRRLRDLRRNAQQRRHRRQTGFDGRGFAAASRFARGTRLDVRIVLSRCERRAGGAGADQDRREYVSPPHAPRIHGNERCSSRCRCVESDQAAVADDCARSARAAAVLDRRRRAAAAGPALVRYAAIQRADAAAAADPDRREHDALRHCRRGRGAADFARRAGRAGREPAAARARLHGVLRGGARAARAAPVLGEHRAVRSDLAARGQCAHAAGRAVAARQSIPAQSRRPCAPACRASAI